jgi:predicted nucleic acid-binding Zn ribbon protein
VVKNTKQFIDLPSRWATCTDCGEEYDIRRLTQAGFSTCMDCGEINAKKVIRCTVPMHKSNIIVVSRKEDLLYLNKP